MKPYLRSASIFLALFTPLSLAAQKLRIITPMHVEPRIDAYAEILDGKIVFDINPDAVRLPSNPPKTPSATTDIQDLPLFHKITTTTTLKLQLSKQTLEPGPRGRFTTPTTPGRSYLPPQPSTTTTPTPTPPMIQPTHFASVPPSPPTIQASNMSISSPRMPDAA